MSIKKTKLSVDVLNNISKKGNQFGAKFTNKKSYFMDKVYFKLDYNYYMACFKYSLVLYFDRKKITEINVSYSPIQDFGYGTLCSFIYLSEDEADELINRSTCSGGQEYLEDSICREWNECFAIHSKQILEKIKEVSGLSDYECIEVLKNIKYKLDVLCDKKEFEN